MKMTWQDDCEWCVSKDLEADGCCLFETIPESDWID